MGQHFKTLCTCGVVINQCRCIGEKKITIIEEGCAKCRNKASEVNKHQHKREVCSCGEIIMTCKCPDGADNVTVIENGCVACQNPVKAKYNSLYKEWTITDSHNGIISVTKEEWERIHSIIHEHYHGED